MTDWGRYLTCSVCKAEATEPCMRQTGLAATPDGYERRDIEADAPHSSRPVSARAGGARKTPARRKDLMPAARTPTAKQTTARAAAERRAIDQWTALASRRRP